MTEKVFVGDVGTRFEITLREGGRAVDISSATKTEIFFEKSDGTILTKTAQFKNSGTDGIIEYFTIEGDIDIDGIYRLQAYVEMPTGKFFSDTHKFKAHKNLKP